MNDLEKQTRRNNVRRLLRHTSGIHVNCIRINTNNTYDHERKKFDICWKLAKEGKDFVTEAEPDDKSWRADIISLDDAVILEVLKSEKEESVEEKKTRYPLPIIKVRC